MGEILDKMQAADVIVMASPVYFYSVDAQMKAVIDRCVARWTKYMWRIIRIPTLIWSRWRMPTRSLSASPNATATP